MHEKTISPVTDVTEYDDKTTWHRPVYTVTKKKLKSPKFPPDEDINLWLKTNAPRTFDQLVNIRYSLYHKCSREPYVVTKKGDEAFTFTGRSGSLRVVSNQARKYLLWKLRSFGRNNGWIGALPHTKRARK
jgi:hypothetical protein